MKHNIEIMCDTCRQIHRFPMNLSVICECNETETNIDKDILTDSNNMLIGEKEYYGTNDKKCTCGEIMNIQITCFSNDSLGHVWYDTNSESCLLISWPEDIKYNNRIKKLKRVLNYDKGKSNIFV